MAQPSPAPSDVSDMPPPPLPRRSRRTTRPEQNREADLHLQQLLRRRPRDLLMALCSDEEVAWEGWLRRSLEPLGTVAPEVVAEWRLVLRDRRPQLLKDAVAELEDLRCQRRHFDDKLDDALDLLRGEDDASTSDNA